MKTQIFHSFCESGELRTLVWRSLDCPFHTFESRSGCGQFDLEVSGEFKSRERALEDTGQKDLKESELYLCPEGSSVHFCKEESNKYRPPNSPKKHSTIMGSLPCFRVSRPYRECLPNVKRRQMIAILWGVEFHLLISHFVSQFSTIIKSPVSEGGSRKGCFSVWQFYNPVTRIRNVQRGLRNAEKDIQNSLSEHVRGHAIWYVDGSCSKHNVWRLLPM